MPISTGIEIRDCRSRIFSVWIGFLAQTRAVSLGLFALNATLDALLAWMWTRAGRRIVYDLAEDLFARLQRR